MENFLQEKTENRRRLIAELDADHVAALEQFSAEHPDFRSMEIPDSVLQFLLPEKLMDMMSDPRNGQIIPLVKSANRLQCVVVERNRPGGVSDPEIYTRFQEIIKAESEKAGKKIFIIPPAPEGVDEFHVQFSRFVNEGLLTLNDKIYSSFDLSQGDQSDVVIVGAYFDSNAIHGKGVTQEFYQRLSKMMVKLGFKYVVGINSDRNKGFFEKVLGRKSVKDLPYDQIKYLLPEVSPTVIANATVQFLKE